MKALKNIGWVFVNIMLIGSLMVAAFMIPDWYVKLKDQRTMEQVNRRMLEMDTYELTFHNFAEKLYTIAGAQGKGIGIQLIEMPDNETDVGNEELTGYIMQELEMLLEKTLENDVYLDAEDLSDRSLYMLYGSYAGENSNALAGIYLYKLVYVTEWMGYDNVEMEFYMDVEFHKLYRFSISTFYSNVTPTEGAEFIKLLQGDWETMLSEGISLDMLSEYWELEKTYQTESVYGDEFTWKEKKNMWGKGVEDVIFLREKKDVLGAAMPLHVWSYLTYSGEFQLFNMQMGIWLESEYSDTEVYDYTD